MQKKNINWIFNEHSIERFFERTTLNVSKKDIANAVLQNQKTNFKRLNVSRSMSYIHVKKEVIKAIIHRKKNKLITILPWRSIYQCNLKVHINKYNTTFKVKLFPDCYLETKKSNALTKIYKETVNLYGDDPIWEPINYNHPLFEEIFNTAWFFFQLDEDHLKIQNERRKGIETFEVKGKAKTIETIHYLGIDRAKNSNEK